MTEQIVVANDNGDEREKDGWIVLGGSLGAVCLFITLVAIGYNKIVDSFIDSLAAISGIG